MAGTNMPADLEFVNDALDNAQQNLLATSTSLRKTMGASPYFTEQPGLAAAIASGHPTDDQLTQIGQLVSGLELEKRVKLAKQQNAHLHFSYEQRRVMDAMGLDYSPVDAETIQQKSAQLSNHLAKAKNSQAEGVTASAVESGKSSGSLWGSITHAVSSLAHAVVPDLNHGPAHAAGVEAGKVAEKVSSATNVLVDNPIVRPVLHGLDVAADEAKTPYRLAADYVRPVAGEINAAIPGLRDYGTQMALSAEADKSENRRSMEAQGYDPSSFFSNLAFYSHGEEIYHDMAGLRKQYGDSMVELAKQFSTLNDEGKGDQFLDPSWNPDTFDERQKAAFSPEWGALLTQVNARHASPGRDVARTVGLAPGTKGFSALSGAVDGLISWYTDPTLIVGRTVSAVKAGRVALNSLVDAEGVRRVMGTNKAVQRGWQTFLDDAKVTREGDAAEAGAALARIRARTPTLVPMLQEVNGGARIVGYTPEGKAILGGDPITNLDDLTDYLTSTNGLLRINIGKAAREGAFMPGSISRFGYRSLKANAAGALASRNASRLAKLNVSISPWRYIPTPGEAVDLNGARVAGQEALNYRRYGVGQVNGAADKIKAWATFKAVRARFATTAKRITNLAPKPGVQELAARDSVENIRRLAATFLPQSTARTLAAQFSAADMAGKRQIAKGLQEQLIHASGLEASATGRKIAERMRKDLADMDQHRYSVDSNLDTISDEAGTRRVALHDGQLNTGVWFPSFQEMHRLAAKASIYDYLGRGVMESPTLDKALRAIHVGWLTTVSGGLRNGLDEQAGFILRTSPLTYAKSLAAANRAKLQQKIALAEIPEQDAEDVIAGRLSFAKAAIMGQLRQNREFVHGKLSKLVPADYEDGADAIFRRGEADRYLAELDGINARALTATQIPDGQEALNDILAAGLQPRRLGWKLQGYKGIEPNGIAGARAWAGNLNQRFTDTGMGQKLLDIIENDTPDTRRAALMHMVSAPQMRQWREYAEAMRPWKDKSMPIEARRQAVADFIDKQVQDLRPLLSDQAGNLHADLIKYLRSKNHAPSVHWFQEHIKNDLRPAQVITRDYVPIGADGGSLAEYTGALASKAYETVVSKPAALIARHPIFLHNYVRANKELKGVEKAWIEAGVLPERADEMMAEAVAQRAFEYTTRMVDNPDVASQFAVISRNFFNFSRAAEDWGRRWGRTFIEDPTRIRKAQLAYEGAVHAGVIQRDGNGQPMFVYPGSGFAMQAALSAAKAMGIPGMVQIPAIPNLTSKVMFLNASLDNPVQLTVSPVFSIPLRMLAAHFPGHQLGFQELEKVAFGAQGQNKHAYEDILPTSAMRFWKALNPSDRDSQQASAAMATLANLDAAGLIPKADATPKERDNFIQALRVGIRNQAALRALFAFFLPASPSQPTNTIPGETDADAVYRAEGVRNLADEFKKMINDFGYTKAVATWTKLHPHKLAYTVPQSDTQVQTVLSATNQTMGWMEDHLPTLQKYGVAAYFIPQSKGKFSQEAYNAQLELGMRQRKTVSQFYNDVRIGNAENLYYSSKDSYDAEVAKAKAKGDDARVKNLQAAWSDWKQVFMAANPLFVEKQAEWGIRTVERQQQIAELHQMVKDPQARKVMPEPGVVQNMLTAYDGYTAWYNANASKRDSQTEAQKQAVKAAYGQYMAQIGQNHPDLKPLLNGVFRIDSIQTDSAGAN